EVPASGTPIDGVRRGRRGGTDLVQDLALRHALPRAPHQGRKGLRIFRTVPMKTLHRSHGPLLLGFGTSTTPHAHTCGCHWARVLLAGIRSCHVRGPRRAPRVTTAPPAARLVKRRTS